jgi:ABC-2 type transport system permease protein
MKKIRKIAKAELNVLFYSPIAWLLLVIFLFQCGLAYTTLIKSNIIAQELGGVYLRSLGTITLGIFSSSSGVFSQIISKVYLYLPLITMGLISREVNAGTINLLLSSPVKLKEIILGKYLAMMIYNLLLIAAVAIFCIAAMFNIKSADYGVMISGLFGLYLLLCAYAAIGLFMSCLTSYQIVAALSTLVIFAILSYIGTVWQDIDFVRSMTYFLSISGRTESMLGGYITSKDILYFLVIIYIFLGMSIYKLEAARKTQSFLIKTACYSLIILSGLAIGLAGSARSLTLYFDLSANKMNTLTPNSQMIIKDMNKGPLEITSYINLLEWHFSSGKPDQRNIDARRWEPYLRFKPDIKLNYVYYYDSVKQKAFYKYNPGMTLKMLAKKYAAANDFDLKNLKTPIEIHQLVNLKPENNRYVMQLKYNGKTTFLRLFDDQIVYPTETETSAALKRLTMQLPKIAFLTDELERSPNKIGDRDYKTVTSQINYRYALINQGFDVDSLSLNKQNIPNDIAALVIADPKVAFSPASMAKIQNYISNGGNILIAGEPGKQAIVNPLINAMGVRIMDGKLVQKSKDLAPDLLLPHLMPAIYAFSKELKNDAADSLFISMPGAAALAYENNSPFDIHPLLLTDEKLSWLKKDKFVADSGAVNFSAAKGDQKQAFPTALALTRKINGKEQRIIITGDADFMSNAELSRYNVRTANFDFNRGIMGWFTYGQFPIDASRPKTDDNRFNLTSAGVTKLKIFALGILPGLIILAGTVMLIRRRRK